MTSESLKPCAHCGGTDIQHVPGQLIACMNVKRCGAQIDMGSPWGGPEEDGIAWLINAWNTRAAQGVASAAANSNPTAAPPQGAGGDVGKLKEVERDAQRYRRLRVMGCAVMDHPNLEEGLVSRFTNLDDIIDADLKTMRSRGEFALATPSSEGEGARPLFCRDDEDPVEFRRLVGLARRVEDVARIIDPVAMAEPFDPDRGAVQNDIDRAQQAARVKARTIIAALSPQGVQETVGPATHDCDDPDSGMCARCDCWKFTREMCS